MCISGTSYIVTTLTIKPNRHSSVRSAGFWLGRLVSVRFLVFERARAREACVTTDWACLSVQLSLVAIGQGGRDAIGLRRSWYIFSWGQKFQYDHNFYYQFTILLWVVHYVWKKHYTKFVLPMTLDRMFWENWSERMWSNQPLNTLLNAWKVSFSNSWSKSGKITVKLSNSIL